MKNIQSHNILVIGDVMLDTFFMGDVKRISPEAPVPVFRKRSERCTLGGASNVAANLVAAGQKVSMMSVIGTDNNGEKLLQLFREHNIDMSLIQQTGRSTTTKTRFLADNNQQMLRLDVEDTYEISEDETNNLLFEFKKRIDTFDLIIVSDYLKGLLTYNFTQGVINYANDHGVKVIIDVKDPKIEKYQNSYLLKPNLKEVRDLTNMPAETDEEIIEASEVLRTRCNCEYVLTTCGGHGMVLVSKNTSVMVPIVGKEVFDVTGAGDTVIAYLGACLANDMEITDAIKIANFAAGIQVSKVGTSSVYLKEVEAVLKENTDKHVNGYKLLKWEDLENFKKGNNGKKIVFTNGCFDILHIGHIRYLKEAASLGNILVVGLNSDESVRKLKGPERPINNQEDRAELLFSLDFVDYVIIFNEDTPDKLIRTIQPDVLVKGGDYKPEEVVGMDFVEANGGKLVLIDFVKGKSTTNIIKKIKN